MKKQLARTTLLLLALMMPTFRAQAQCRTRLDVTSVDEYYFFISDTLNSIQTNPVILPAPALLSQFAGIAESYQNGCGDFAFFGLHATGDGLDIDMETALPGVAGAVNDFAQNGVSVNGSVQNLTDLISLTPCRLRPYQRLSHLGGDINSYGFHAGTGPYRRKIRKATYSTCRDVVIQNNSNVAIELPVTVSGSIFAAESFGDANRNWARVRMRMFGTINGNSYSASIPANGNYLESVTVLPEEDSATIARRVTVAQPNSQITVRVTLNAEAETIVQAKSTGLYGLLSGSATAGVSFPNSIDLFNFTGPNGAALPAGVLIYDAAGGVYADTRLFPGRPNFVTVANLRRVGNEFLADVTITNNGPGEARDVQITGATLNNVNTTTAAQTIGRLIPELPAGRATRTLRFPLTAGTAGASVLLKVQGVYQGGRYGGDIQVTLP